MIAWHPKEFDRNDARRIIRPQYNFLALSYGMRVFIYAHCTSN